MSEHLSAYNVSSVLQNVRTMASRVFETIKQFLKNMRIRSEYPPVVLEHMQHQYDTEPEVPANTERAKEVSDQVVDLMNEVFHGQHPGEYLRSIQSVEQREQILESFAKRLLALYGISDVKIVMAYSKERYAGYYNFDQKILCLNSSYMSLDNPILLLDAVDTILHESRHALQHAAMHGHNPLEFDRETIISWIKNAKNYIRPETDPAGYRSQPMESDAFSSAMYTIHCYLHKNKGNDEKNGEE